MLLLLFAALAVAQTTLPFGTVVPGSNPAQGCTPGVCLRDWFNCRTNVCVNNVTCNQVNIANVPARQCADQRNATNYDVCRDGMCFGSYYASTFLRFTTVSAPVDPRFNFNYPYTVANEVVRVLGLDPDTTQPNVRACFEASQRVSVSLEGNQQVVRLCSMTFNLTAVSGSNFTFTYFVELVSGPQALNTAQLAQTLVGLVNSSALLNSLYVRSATVLNFNPFAAQAEFIPWLNGVYLGIAIGVACGVFMVTVLGCVAYYWIKSARDIQGGVLGQTDSTASVQSGSSFRSESHASATAE